MDFPLFHLDVIGNRLLVALTAVTHVLINHPMAVGLYPLVAFMEWRGLKEKSFAWDEAARKVTFVAFIVTTTIGALTGVGIWLITSLVAPFAIGSLLRVFFWGWFAEWIVFITEVVLILIYYLTWDKWRDGAAKERHLKTGWTLAVFSWLTMALIVAVLGFMMSTGGWKPGGSLWTAFFNPLYLPQLAFRTGFAMATAGMFVCFLSGFVVKDDAFRAKVVRQASGWTLAWSPLLMAGALWYWSRVPGELARNTNVALLTTAFQRWESSYLALLALAAGTVGLAAWTGWKRPKVLKRWTLVLPFVLCTALLGQFERVREFIRKPWVIQNRLYANGVRPEELPLLQKEGLLTHAAYARMRSIEPGREAEAGREVFMLACSRCHTTDGVNGLTARFRNLYGDEPWNRTGVRTFILNMHKARPFMPPFPGTEAEAGALADYVLSLQVKPESASGAQSAGIAPAPLADAPPGAAAGAPVPRDLPWPLPTGEMFLKVSLVALFLVHILFVDLMVGGSLLTTWFERKGAKDPRWDGLALSVAKTVTVNKSLAVVMGIGPLLCINLVYTSEFYAANAMTGHAWPLIIPLVTTAFLLTYLHKYTWASWTGEKKAWHKAAGLAAAGLFLMIPVIFLSNINLMLFPSKWGEVAGFLSSLRIGNVLPRYLHFLCAAVAVTGLFLAWWWDRPSVKDADLPAGFSRAELRRTFLGVMFYGSLAQFAAGPLVLFTLPRHALEARTVGMILGGAGVAAVGLWMLWRERRRLDAGVGRPLWPIAAVFGLVVLFMGMGRHLYREAALAPFKQAVMERSRTFEARLAAEARP